MSRFVIDPSYGLGKVIREGNNTEIDFPSLAISTKNPKARFKKFKAVALTFLPSSTELEERYSAATEQAERLIKEARLQELFERVSKRGCLRPEPYNENHCWHCKGPLRRDFNFTCNECNGMICWQDERCLCGTDFDPKRRI